MLDARQEAQSHRKTATIRKSYRIRERGQHAVPLQIVRNDITQMRVDAIVNAANSSLLGGGGVDGCIHRAAGPQLLEECKTLGGCPVGSAKITAGYNLPTRYVIHAVGPVWYGGDRGERELLSSCYRASLALAKENRCESVAFPLISAGAYGYPRDRALRVAVDTIGEFLMHEDMLVYIVVFDRASFAIGERLFSDIAEYIDDRYADAHTDRRREQMSRLDNAPAISGGLWSESEMTYGMPGSAPNRDMSSERIPLFRKKKALLAAPAPMATTAHALSLEDMLTRLDESFSQSLLRLIDARGMTDAECYKRANIDRKLFSKIRNDIHYRPSKPTVLAFAVALRLSLSETKELLAKAGFALSHSSKFDIIVEYFITRGIYNVFEINEALFAFDQNLLGS